MSIMFEPSEIFQFAVRIEENGERFYRQMSEKMKDADIKGLFTYLAEEEVKHKKTYENMVSSLETYQPFESYPGEYFAYLRAYADNIIFNQEQLEKKISEIEDEASAIDFAIDAELNSILYYQEIKKIVSENKHQEIDRIIDEERRHFVKLSEMREMFK